MACREEQPQIRSQPLTFHFGAATDALANGYLPALARWVGGIFWLWLTGSESFLYFPIWTSYGRILWCAASTEVQIWPSPAFTCYLNRLPCKAMIQYEHVPVPADFLEVCGHLARSWAPCRRNFKSMTYAGTGECEWRATWLPSGKHR